VPKCTSVGCNRTLGPCLHAWNLNLMFRPQLQAGRPSPSWPAPPVSRQLHPNSTWRFATCLTYLFLVFVKTRTWINEIKIWMKHLERDEISTCLSKVLKFISYASTFIPLELELYNGITWSLAYWPSWYNDMWDMLFPNSKSWSILLWNEATLIHAQPWQVLSKAIYIHDIILYPHSYPLHFELGQTSLPMSLWDIACSP
jgi:hypothetical protein